MDHLPENLETEVAIREQMVAYEQKDLPMFMSYFDDEISLFLNNEEVSFVSGKEKVATYYQKLFDDSPSLKVKIHKRMATGDFVLLEEEIKGYRGQDSFKTMAVYELKNKKISKARFYI